MRGDSLAQDGVDDVPNKDGGAEDECEDGHDKDGQVAARLDVDEHDGHDRAYQSDHFHDPANEMTAQAEKKRIGIEIVRSISQPRLSHMTVRSKDILLDRLPNDLCARLLAV